MTIQKIINKPKEQFILEFETYYKSNSLGLPDIPHVSNSPQYAWYLKSVYRNVGKEPDDDFNEERFTMECSKYFATEDEAVKDLEQVLALLGIE